MLEVLLFSQATMLMIALGAHGFAPGLHRGAIRMSSIEVFANEAAAPIVKEQLLSTIGTDGLLLDPKSDDGLSVEEFVLELSANNPTAEPARSKLLNGKWEVRVASIICLPEKQPLSPPDVPSSFRARRVGCTAGHLRRRSRCWIH